MELLVSSTLGISKTPGYSQGRMISSLQVGSDIFPPRKKDKKVSQILIIKNSKVGLINLL